MPTPPGEGVSHAISRYLTLSGVPPPLSRKGSRPVRERVRLRDHFRAFLLFIHTPGESPLSPDLRLYIYRVEDRGSPIHDSAPPGLAPPPPPPGWGDGGEGRRYIYYCLFPPAPQASACRDRPRPPDPQTIGSPQAVQASQYSSSVIASNT